MTSDLSILAARLRDHISICADELPAADAPPDPTFAAHAEAEFNGLALVLFARQFAHNPPYRIFCEARGALPSEISRWTEIPAVPAALFKEFEFSCLPPERRTRVFYSSGTTGQRPGRHLHNAESLAVYEASLWPWFAAHLLADLKSEISNIQFLILTPPPALAPNSSLVHMFETVRRKLGGAGVPAGRAEFLGKLADDGSWTLNFDLSATRLVEAHSADSPLLLAGTAFSFVHLLDFLAEKNLRFKLPPGSRVMETGGYKNRSRSLPKAELHALITDRLGVSRENIVCEYGMSELSSQAYDRAVQNSKFKIQNAERAFRFPPWARAQIVSPETGGEVADGETGLLRIFDLANVFSVLAIQTEDLAIRRGDGFELVGRANSSEPRGCSLMAGDSQFEIRRL